MEWIGDREAIINYIKKYRWAILVLAVGFLLMLFPEGESKVEAPIVVSEDTSQEQANLQENLEQILCQLEGAGKVRVLLTESLGPQTVYQTDQNKHQIQESEEIRSETVILTGADRSEVGLVRRVDPPQYLGAVILCQGADNASVRLAIVDAVGTATGLSSDKISVWKMK